MSEPQLLSIPLSRLVPRDKNPNVMPESQFKLLVEAIRKIGFVQPILVREPKGLPPDQEAAARLGGGQWWEVIDGAHRLKAAAAAGLKEIPAVLIDANTDEATALQIGMNKMRGELDYSAVARALDELTEGGWTRTELTLTGFALPEIDDLLKTIQPRLDDIDLSAGVGSVEDPASEKAPASDSGVHVLEITFQSKGALAATRRKLKRLGEGDLANGLLKLLEDV